MSLRAKERHTGGLAERQQARRADLLSAGIALLGDQQHPHVTVRAVCRHSELTERYFYENFPDRDQFVREVYREVGERAHHVLADAVQHAGPRPRAIAQAAVESFVQFLAGNPQAGRVLLIAPLREPVLGGQGLALVPSFVALVHDQLSALEDPAEKHMAALGIVGALTNLFIAYLDGTLRVPEDRLARHCVTLVLSASH